MRPVPYLGSVQSRRDGKLSPVFNSNFFFLPLMAAKVLASVLLKVTVEVLRGDKKEKIAVVLEPKLDET